MSKWLSESTVNQINLLLEFLVDKADAYDCVDMKQDELAQKIKVSRATITNYIGILKKLKRIERIGQTKMRVLYADPVALNEPVPDQPREDFERDFEDIDLIKRVFFPADAPLICEINKTLLENYESQRKLRDAEQKLRDAESEAAKQRERAQRMLDKRVQKSLAVNSEK